MALAVVLAACGRDATPNADPSEPTPTQTTTPTPTPTTTPSPSPDPLVTMTTRFASGKNGDETWSIEIPTLHGLGAVEGKVNAALAKAFAVGPSATPTEGDVASDGTVDTTVVLYEVNDRYVVVRGLVSVFPTGAAHGFSTVEHYVFDRTSGERVTLAGWFKPGMLNDALRAMSAYARPRLHDVFGPEWDQSVDEGTKPKAVTYEDVAPLPEGLEVTFGEYEVAAYAAGLPVVTIPWSKLTPYLARPPAPGDADPPYRDASTSTRTAR